MKGYFSHEEHEESQKNTKKEERRRKIYIYKNEEIIKISVNHPQSVLSALNS